MLPVVALCVSACASATSNTATTTGDAGDTRARSTTVQPDRPLGAPASGASGSLDRALATATTGTTLLLTPGHYVLDPEPYTDPSCGNCANATDTVPATLGARMSGVRVQLRGNHADSVFIHTRAGYGLLVEDCEECTISGVTITDGTRSTDGRATDAGVVVRRATLTMEQCAISDNIGDSATVAATIVGIAGIAVREAGVLALRNCTIRRNSWDGIAMYRGARATITDNVIDGVDKASGARVGGGRGVGIGLTYDARAVIERNRVTRYWKGIGIFVEADADVRENIVEDILTWGIALWGPNGAMPAARIERNVVYRTGACGVMIDRPEGGAAPGTMADNVVIMTGQNERYDTGEPYCWQRPLARHSVPAAFTESGNLLFDNRQPTEAGKAPPPLPQIPRATMLQRARPLTTRLAAMAALRQALLFSEIPELSR